MSRKMTHRSELVFVFMGLVWSEKSGYVAQRGHDATRFMAQVQGPVAEASGAPSIVSGA